MSLKSSKKSVKVSCFMAVQFFIQLISVNQDSKLKGMVKKYPISLIYHFLFGILRRNFWFQRDISLFFNLSGILDEGIDILASISFWPLLIIELVARAVPARLIIR